MLASSTPAKIQVPFATSGDKVTIPIPSQIGINDGRASWVTGFVPLNAAPLSSGGVAPFETDFNGIFNQITAIQQWQCAGAGFKYDATFATAIGGYPAGAKLTSTSGTQVWSSLVDNNLTDPNGGSSSGWVLSTPGSNAGVIALSSSRSMLFSDVGMVLRATSTLTYTMPTPSSLGLVIGNKVTVIGNTGANVTIDPSAGATISYGSSVGGITVTDGQSASFVVANSTTWQVVDTTAYMQRNSDFMNSLGSAGYQKLPGGFIMQWQTVSVPIAPSGSTSTQVFSFPIAFKDTVFGCSASVLGIGTTANSNAFVSAVPTSLNGGTAQNNYTNSPISVFVISIGK